MDDADRATEIQTRAQQYQERHRRFNGAVHHARIYSACTICGEPIEPARLRVMPFASRCLSCQRAHETRRP